MANLIVVLSGFEFPFNSKEIRDCALETMPEELQRLKCKIYIIPVNKLEDFTGAEIVFGERHTYFVLLSTHNKTMISHGPFGLFRYADLTEAFYSETPFIRKLPRDALREGYGPEKIEFENGREFLMYFLAHEFHHILQYETYETRHFSGEKEADEYAVSKIQMIRAARA